MYFILAALAISLALFGWAVHREFEKFDRTPRA
jgi:hypothetical protein